MSRLAVMYPDPDHATACAEHEHDKEIAATEREERIQEGIQCCRAWNQERFVNDNIADPSYDLAILFKIAALNWDDTATIGDVVKRMVENRYRRYAEWVDADRRD